MIERYLKIFSDHRDWLHEKFTHTSYHKATGSFTELIRIADHCSLVNS